MPIRDIHDEFRRIKAILSHADREFQRSDYRQAAQLYKEALSYLTQVYDSNNHDVLSCMKRLAESHYNLHEYGETKDLLRKVLPSGWANQLPAADRTRALLMFARSCDQSGAPQEAGKAYADAIAQSKSFHDDGLRGTTLEAYISFLRRTAGEQHQLAELEAELKNLRATRHKGTRDVNDVSGSRSRQMEHSISLSEWRSKIGAKDQALVLICVLIFVSSVLLLTLGYRRSVVSPNGINVPDRTYVSASGKYALKFLSPTQGKLIFPHGTRSARFTGEPTLWDFIQMLKNHDQISGVGLLPGAHWKTLVFYQEGSRLYLLGQKESPTGVAGDLDSVLTLYRPDAPEMTVVKDVFLTARAADFIYAKTGHYPDILNDLVQAIPYLRLNDADATELKRQLSERADSHTSLLAKQIHSNGTPLSIECYHLTPQYNNPEYFCVYGYDSSGKLLSGGIDGSEFRLKLQGGKPPAVFLSRQERHLITSIADEPIIWSIPKAGFDSALHFYCDLMSEIGALVGGVLSLILFFMSRSAESDALKPMTLIRKVFWLSLFSSILFIGCVFVPQSVKLIPFAIAMLSFAIAVFVLIAESLARAYLFLVGAKR